MSVISLFYLFRQQYNNENFVFDYFSEHFLVFLTGQEEIDGVIRQLKATKHYFPVFPCPLYAALPKKSQEKAFTIPPYGTRKIVVATNIAETSLTIPGIKVVIDSGFIKSK